MSWLNRAKRDPKKILVFSLKYLGDVIVETPALRALDERFPDAEISVALWTGYEDVLRGNPHVDNILPIDFEKCNFFDDVKVFWMLRKLKFDMVVSFEPDDRESLWAFFCGAKRRIAPAYQPFEFLWNVRVPIREDTMEYDDYYCEIIRAAGAPVASKKTEIFVSDEAAHWAEIFLRQIPPGKQYLIGIHPGAREPNRRWSPKKFAEIIARLSARGDVITIVLCGRGEKKISDEIKSHLNVSDSVTFTEALTIQTTAALMRQCTVCITNDSAPRHIAAAVRTRTIATMPRSKVPYWTLYNPQDHALLVGDDANPDALVDSVGVQEMFDCVERMLRTTRHEALPAI